MSDYCESCAFDPASKLGPRACPFNYLYWNFLIKNEAQLAPNPRMAMPYRTLAAMNEKQRAAIRQEAGAFIKNISIEQAAVRQKENGCR